MELRKYGDAQQWCDEGLRIHPADKKLQELRSTADKQKVRNPSRLLSRGRKDRNPGSVCVRACVSVCDSTHVFVLMCVFRGRRREMPGKQS